MTSLALRALQNGVVERADLGFGGHVGQLLRGAGDFHAQFLAQVPEHFFEGGVVGPLGPKVLGELPGLAAGGGPCRARRGCGCHRASGGVAGAALCRGRRRPISSRTSP